MTLREWREAAGLTQRELANLARVARSSVSHIENGRYRPTPGFAGKVCRTLSEVLGCTINTWDVFPDTFYVVSARLVPSRSGLPPLEFAGAHRTKLMGGAR